jgi:hypothetical protein
MLMLVLNNLKNSYKFLIFSSPDSCEPICGLPLRESSYWVFHFDSDVFITHICMSADKTPYPMGYPLKLSYKSALHSSSLRIHPVDLGSEKDRFLLTFLVSFPGPYEPIFWTSSPRRYPFCELPS